jgi:CxxC-x17-CxxC domain-containing protein
MEFQDKVLRCVDCGTDFIFTAGEQIFFHEKHFQNEPRRCRPCKAKKVSVVRRPLPPPRHFSGKIQTQCNCSHCGKMTTVPFKPTQGRPVLCRDCFDQKRPSATA